MTAFPPSSTWLPLPARHETDVVIAAILAALALSQRLWSRYLPISDNIPDRFWHRVPQQSSSHPAASARQARSRNIKHVFSERDLDMVVFWGSQSGRAEMLSRRLAKAFHDRFRLKALAVDLSEYDHTHLPSLERHQLCGFVLSTYGDGDPPDNANGLWGVLNQLPAGRFCLGSLRYVIFGLGNSNYRQFNRAAEHVDTALQSVGAVRMGPAGCGDDAGGGTDDAFVSWRKECEEALKCELQLSVQTSTYQPSFSVRENAAAAQNVHLGIPHPGISSQGQGAPIKPMQVSRMYKLWEDDARLCIHVDLDLGGDRSVKYKTGDHLAIWPNNPDAEVNRLVSLLNLDGNQHAAMCLAPAAGSVAGEKPPVPSPTTAYALLRYYLEICAAVSQETVADLMWFAPSDDSRSEIRRITGAFEAEVRAAHATLADILEIVGRGARWDIPLSFLLERIEPMKPRYYSISSSTVVQPRTVSLTAVVTKPPPHNYGSRALVSGCYGLTTSYLSALEELINAGADAHATSWPPKFAFGGPGGVLGGGKVFGRIRQSPFKLPAKASAPVIMVGAGTGAAPFRAFVQERVRRRELGEEVGKTFLFLGFRHPDVDLIYKEDWMAWGAALGQDEFKFRTAFSRDGASHKAYVQDLLKESAGEVMGLLAGNVGCRLYICGSAAMARDVAGTLIGMKMGFDGDDEEKAAAWVKQLRQSKQLLEDVWG